MRHVARLVRGIAVLVVACAATPARPDGTPADVRSLWDALTAVRADLRDAQQARDTARIRDLRPKEADAESAFTQAFAAVPWDAFDVATDEALLDAGLVLAGNHALGRDDAAGAARAFETYLAKLPKGASAALVEGVLLPSARIAAQDVDGALPLVEKHAHGIASQARGPALVLLGDLLAATKGAAAAREAWAQVEGVPPAAAGRSRTDSAMRLALVGRPAPEIDSKAWLGADAKPLSALRGSAILLDFWATWSASCRRAQPRLETLHRTRAKDGLLVVGVTRFFDYGYVPPEGAPENETDGERLAGMTGPDFHDHLAAYRKSLTITYPFVVAEPGEFKAYQATNIPTTVVVDRRGDVAFLSVGGGCDTLLRLAIERVVSEPAAPEPPK